MKGAFLFLVVAGHIISCSAQTASGPFGNNTDSFTAGGGAARHYVQRASESPATFAFSQMPSAALPRLAIVRDDSDLLSGTPRGPAYGIFADADSQNASSSGRGTEGDSGAASRLDVQPAGSRQPSTRIHWRAANGEALLSTGIMHTFNLWTEAGTRDALYGPWAKDWLQSVGELRGWSESDRFMAPYVGHSIQGSIFGYILRQNDPKYRDV